MKPSVLFVALVTFCLNNFAVQAQEATNPIRYTWIASSCETWNCAAAALILADGEPNVIVLPTNVEDRPWLVLRRVEEGSIFIPEEESFGCDVYGEAELAMSHYLGTDTCRKPMFLTAPDGSSVVVALKQCSGLKRRAVR